MITQEMLLKRCVLKRCLEYKLRFGNNTLLKCNTALHFTFSLRNIYKILAYIILPVLLLIVSLQWKKNTSIRFG